MRTFAYFKVLVFRPPRPQAQLMRKVSRSAWLVALLTLGLVAPLLPAGAQTTGRPRLQLRAARTDVTLTRPEGRKVFLDLSVYIAALEAPFEIRVRRADYTSPLEAFQVLQGPAGDELVSIPADALEGWGGLKNFFEVAIERPDGFDVRTIMLDFCPNTFDHQRVEDSGPRTPAYPFTCFGNPFALGMVWGLDEGWAVRANTYDFRDMSVSLPEGKYKVTVSIARRFQEMFSVEPTDASVQVNLEIKTGSRGCHHCPHPEPPFHDENRRPHSVTIPSIDDPDPALLPDLIALPAWGLYVANRRGKSRLTFGATVWTGGASSLVVEGYRRPNEDTMDAYQYFFRDGQPIGRAAVGEFAFDPLPRHNHWHFLQFARYTLLKEDQAEVVRSKKEAFCLAPTDAVDLLLPGAAWQPGLMGEGTMCGQRDSLWIREVLPLGWGDTYFQSVPGQSFDITEVPNGTYYVAVTANPDGALFEQSAANNTMLRQVILSGRPGRRRVEVPPWNGIDTEGRGFGR